MDIKIFNKETGELIDEWRETEELKNLQEEVKSIEEKIKKEEEYRKGMRRETQCIDDGIGIEESFDLSEFFDRNYKLRFREEEKCK